MFKNVSLTILIRLVSAISALLSVPMLLKLLGVDNYGVWAALTSVIGWVMLFDFGAGITVKNSVSRTLVNGAFESLHEEVIQTLRFLLVISVVAMSIFAASTFLFDFLRNNRIAAVILIVPVMIVFPLTIGSMILQGARKFYLNSGLALIPQVLFLLFLYGLSLHNESSDINNLSIIYAFLNTTGIVVIWWLAKKKIGLNKIQLRKIFTGSLFVSKVGTSLRFFVLQVSSICLYSMGTVLTISNLSSSDAAHYDIVNKVYLFGMTLFNVVVSVFWTEIVFYIEKRDQRKLFRLYFSFLLIASFFSVAVFVFSIFSPSIIMLWTSGSVQVDHSVTMIFAAVLCIQAITYCGAAVMNSFEELNTQIYLSGAAVLLMMPLSLYLFDLGMGIVSVPIATGLISVPGLFYCNWKAVSLIKGIKYA